METKYTPGPWTTYRHSETTVCSASGRTVAACGGYQDNFSDGGYHRENITNARLIAAAPELVEALREVIGWHDDADNLHKPIEVRAAYMRARALLAKIDGDQ